MWHHLKNSAWVASALHWRLFSKDNSHDPTLLHYTIELRLLSFYREPELLLTATHLAKNSTQTSKRSVYAEDFIDYNAVMIQSDFHQHFIWWKSLGRMFKPGSKSTLWWLCGVSIREWFMCQAQISQNIMPTSFLLQHFLFFLLSPFAAWGISP